MSPCPASAASSLSLSSLSLALPIRTLNPVSLSPPASIFTSVKLICRPISCLSPFTQFSGKKRSFSSGFVSNVAISSEFDQEGGALNDGDDNESNFSPDLKLYVGNLPFSVESSQLATLFESAGNVQMVEVIYDQMTGRSRGFGFVTMSSIDEVEAAAQRFNGYEFEGRTLRVNYGPPPTRRADFSSNDGRREPSFGSSSSNRVYVGNLSWGVDDSALENLFRQKGKVLEAKVVYDRDTGRSRGFGFVTYGSREEVDSAVESLDGVELSGRAIRVSVAESKPRKQF